MHNVNHNKLYVLLSNSALSRFLFTIFKSALSAFFFLPLMELILKIRLSQSHRFDPFYSTALIHPPGYWIGVGQDKCSPTDIALTPWNQTVV